MPGLCGCLRISAFAGGGEYLNRNSTDFGGWACIQNLWKKILSGKHKRSSYCCCYKDIVSSVF